VGDLLILACLTFIMLSKTLFTFIIFFCFFYSNAQHLYKFPTKTLNGPDGMVIDDNNNIYIANWGKDGKGTVVTKIDKNNSEIIYLDSLSSPDG
jgi:hypothetical protein